ncbi:MAG: elongation factor T [Candidatus Berkelbacteria bacterium Licking1014_7]|uniref:Elongation factor Ts n=1 Tax=Candidatus Berkelbacteria bacterium Licking1014_7 TaxID=2017147 RepID=A0A554LI39_9BACT|nr:MAG: elongation factor T [Candidatus Berkelbacteria bacterium Licking1014_7]
MMHQNLKLIQKIRHTTGAGFADIRDALEEAGGDEKKTWEILCKKGASKAEKKKGRALKAGLIDSYIHLGKVGVLIELQTETDFVAKNEKARVLAHNLCLQIASLNPKDINELLAQFFVKDESQTVKDLLNHTIATVGENIEIIRFTRYSLEN